MKEKNFITPKKRERFESIKRKMDKLSDRINTITTDLRKLDDEKSDLQNELKILDATLVKEEIVKIPLDIKKQIISKENRLKQIGKETLKLKKLLWCVVGQKSIGLVWKKEKLDEKFRMLLVGDMKYKEATVKTADEDLKELEEKIKKKLKQNGETITDKMNLLDLSLDVMEKYFSIQDKNYYEGNSDEIYDIAINEVLKKKFNITIHDKSVSTANLDGLIDVLNNVNENVEIEKLFRSLPGVKNITRLYLYATYFNILENLSYINALTKSIDVINFPENKDIGDLERSYITWRSKNKDLVDKINQIKNVS